MKVVHVGAGGEVGGVAVRPLVAQVVDLDEGLLEGATPGAGELVVRARADSSRLPSLSTASVYLSNWVRSAPTRRSTSSDVCSSMTVSNAWRMTPSIANKVSGEQKTILSW